ncbi:MAG TPA: 23S rRNA (adenine(2030)-N(6))-methyltransferase RlmJ, partial [Lacunisphaera sp.]|nr:23S rRNA (adenine(2030)-N(6))-methyltransferase RlmJ [Lacunisphaera sp.]
MNYRHHYHAGNYADVFKHVLLLQLIRAMQRKEKGFLYLDTHAGRGGYDLSLPSVLPDGREREPEHPAGIGRVWHANGLPDDIRDYLDVVRQFNERKGGAAGEIQFYPGSPWIAKLRLRSQDRMVLCELRADDAEALDFEFAREAGVKVLVLDGYTGLKAQLPPPEKRALVLIDPPFESKTEFADVGHGVVEALRRMPGAVIALWYPVTERAPTGDFQRLVRELGIPTLFAEVRIAGDGAQLRMKGCGLVILNPPWRIEEAIRAVLPALTE